MKVHECSICGDLYEDVEGDPIDGLAPGTHWDDRRGARIRPDCGMSKGHGDLVDL